MSDFEPDALDASFRKALGDNGKVSLLSGAITKIETTDPSHGGNDTIAYSGSRNLGAVIDLTAATLDYAPLPASISAQLMDRVSTIQVGTAS